MQTALGGQARNLSIPICLTACHAMILFITAVELSDELSTLFLDFDTYSVRHKSKGKVTLANSG